MDTNDQLILISGFSATGKTASLRTLKNQEKWMYLNTEAGKRLPFKSKFQTYRIAEPEQVIEAFDYAMEHPETNEGIIVDSLTYLMDMYESQRVLTASNTMKAWSDFQQFFKCIVQDRVIRYEKPVIFIAHVTDVFDEKNAEFKTYVPVKGALKNNGIESYFSTVVSAKKLPLKDLKDYKSKLLNITKEEEEVGFKYVFQTRITKGTTNERIRSPMGLFNKAETFIDNDAQLLLDHLKEYYRNGTI